MPERKELPREAAAMAVVAIVAFAWCAALDGRIASLPPFVAALTAPLTMLLARRIGASPAASIVAGLMTALSGDALAIFHQGARMVVPLAVVVTTLGWQRRSLVKWVAGHVLLFLLAPSATSIATILLLVAGGSECVGRSWRAGKPLADAPTFLLTPAAAALTTFLLARAFDLATVPGSHVLWIAVVGGVVALAVTLIERPMPPGRRFQLVVGSALAIGSALALVLLLAGEVMRPSISLLRLMEVARETHWGAWATLLALAAAFALLRMLAVLRRRAPALEIHASALMLVATGLALVDLRHARGFAPIVALTLAFFAFETGRLMTRKRPLSTLAGRVAVTLGFALIVAPPFVDHALSVRQALREERGLDAARGG